jgi:preprotein translocase subunit SecD
MQIAGQCRIVAEFPGVKNPEEVVKALQQTALLEFVDMGASPLLEGSAVQTDHDQSTGAAGGTNVNGTATAPASTATLAPPPTAAPGATAELPPRRPPRSTTPS